MNLKDIAKLAGVSTATVSKIVNQKDDSISAETRERVLKIVKEYNYTPYASIAVAHQKTRVLGILLRSAISFDGTLDGIIRTAQKDGYSCLVYNSCSDSEQELKNITSMCGNRIDGVIWEPLNEESLKNTHYFQDKEIPFITIGPLGSGDLAQLPYETLAYSLTQELVSLGHRNIACLFAKGRRSAAFLSGYQKCLFDNQLQLDESLIFHEMNPLLISKINTHQISGVVSSHYMKSLEFYQLMHSLHYRIPTDFSLISLKNDRGEIPSIPEISTYTTANFGFGVALGKKIISLAEKSPKKSETFTHENKLDNNTTIDIPYNLEAPKILVVGSINVDTYLNVSQLPTTGNTVSSSTSNTYPGGKGINQAIGVAKLGHQVSLIGNVGSDLDSDYIYQTLNHYDINTYGIQRCLNTDTGKAYIFVEPSGNSMISILSGANRILSPAQIQSKEHLFDNAGYCLVQSEIPMETVIETCRVAHRHQVKTIFKPSACDAIPEELYSLVDIIIPNEEELNVLCPYGGTRKEKARKLLTKGIPTVIVTLGKEGCFWLTKDREEFCPSVTFTSVDQTGASDAFISSLASYLLYGYELKKAIGIASYAAGFCISREGVSSALIDRASLETYIGKKEPELLQLTVNKENDLPYRF